MSNEHEEARGGALTETATRTAEALVARGAVPGPVGRKTRRHRAAALAAVVALGSAGLVGVGATAAQAAVQTPDQACTAAGGTPVDLAQGWLTRCTFTKGSHTWTASQGTFGITFDLSGAQGANPSGGTPGAGGEIAGTESMGIDGPFGINVGGQDGSSGTGTTAYDGNTQQPFTGGDGYQTGSGNGGGATVLFNPTYGPVSGAYLVAGGGGGTGDPGYINGTESGLELFPNGADGGKGGVNTTNGNGGGSIADCFLGSCQTDVSGGSGGYGGTAGGAGGSNSGVGSPAGSNVAQGGQGEGGPGGDALSGGGGGGYVGGGAGGSGSYQSGYGLSGSGGGGGGTSWATASLFSTLSSHDGSRTGDGVAVVTTRNSVGQNNIYGFAFGSGQTLASGAQYVTVNNGRNYELVMQTDGNLVEYDDTGAPIWASGTAGHPGAVAAMLSSGAFTIFANQAETQPLWSTGTSGPGNQFDFRTDGSLVMLNNTGTLIWTSTNVFPAGMNLLPGVQFFAAFGYYEFTMQTDGNLVEYNGARKPIWASNTAGHPGAHAFMQGDGNFVVYAPSGQALWATGTNGRGGTQFSFQNDGNLVVYTGNGSPVWASNTAGK